MRIYDFFKEKFIFLVIGAFVYLAMIAFLLVTKTQFEIVIVITFLFWGFTLWTWIVEYARRKAYYDAISSTLKHLDQKYLLCECIEDANFLDGKLLYEIVHETNKSMIDHVNLFKNRQLEYKEYIEMWVHEVKTPLAASRLIMDNNPSPINESVLEELTKVEEYVEQALFYARSSTLEKDYMIKETKLDEIINKVIRKHSKVFIYRKIKLNLENLDFIVYSDSKWIEFIINQVISNAIKYCDPTTPVISINAKQHANMVLLEIKDNGCGVLASDLPRVFDKGFTGTNGRNNQASTGIGLYLCKQLCNKLNLDIQMRMSDETIVSIAFPINSLMFK